MELKVFIKILAKYLHLIIAFAVSGLVIAYFITTNVPTGTKAEQLFLIPVPTNIAEPQSASTIYYGQETARNFTDTAVAILESPDFADHVGSHGQISARKVAPQIIRISASSTDSSSAQNLLNESVSAFNQKVQLKLTPIAANAQVVPTRPTKKISLAAGALTGTIFALFAIGLKEYFRI